MRKRELFPTWALSVTALLITLTAIAIVNDIEAADDDPIPIKVITKLKVGDERFKIMKGMKFAGILPGRQGKSTDIECNDRTDDKGVLLCELKCKKTNRILSKYYAFKFESHRFIEDKKAEILVKKCLPNPEIAEAHFQKISLVIQTTQADFKDIINPLAEINLTTGVWPDGKVIATSLKELTEQPSGYNRVVRLRKMFQDISAVAVHSGDIVIANAFQEYTIAATNVMLPKVAQNMGAQQLPTITLSGNFADLQHNAAATLQAFGIDYKDVISGTIPEDLTKPIDYPAQYEGVFTHLAQMRLGKLSNNQFQALDTAAGLSTAATVRVAYDSLTVLDGMKFRGSQPGPVFVYTEN